MDRRVAIGRIFTFTKPSIDFDINIIFQLQKGKCIEARRIRIWSSYSGEGLK